MCEKLNVAAEFVPVRWWEAIDCVRMTVEMVRGHDPWADRILARPWSLFSLLEYGYLLDNCLRFKNFFILASDARAGVISWEQRSGFIYLYAVGLMPEFKRGTLGLQAARFFKDYCLKTNYQIVVGAIAVQNRPSHMLMGAFGGRLLGLSTAVLNITVAPGHAVESRVEMQPLSRFAAVSAWQRWRLYEVEQVAGAEMVETAARLLGDLPRGQYLALHQNGQDIGFALARGGAGKLAVELFTAREFWSTESTASLISSLACYLGAPIRCLTVTQTHANALSVSEALAFERDRNAERHLFFIRRV